MTYFSAVHYTVMVYGKDNGIYGQQSVKGHPPFADIVHRSRRQKYANGPTRLSEDEACPNHQRTNIQILLLFFINSIRHFSSHCKRFSLAVLLFLEKNGQNSIMGLTNLLSFCIINNSKVGSAKCTKRNMLDKVCFVCYNITCSEMERCPSGLRS